MPELLELRRYLRDQLSGKSALELLDRFRVTLSLTLIISVVGLITKRESPGAYALTLQRFGMNWSNLADGKFWHILTSSYLQAEPGLSLTVFAQFLLSLAACELIAGHRFTFLVAVVSDWTSSVISLCTLRVLAIWDFRDTRQLLALPDAGSSALFHGCLAAAAILLPGRIGRIAFTFLLGLKLGLMINDVESASLVHFFAVVVGGILGQFVLKPRLVGQHSFRASGYDPGEPALGGVG
jgi:hypothetical protein